MAKYKKCPRCELNYILEDVDICDVCKAELKLIKSDIFDDDLEDSILCPFCKKNYIESDEIKCQFCKDKEIDVFTPDIDISEEDDEWRTYLDDEKSLDLEDEDLKILSLTELENEEEEPADEYEEEVFEDVDDFEEVIIDDDEIFDDELDEEEEDEEEDDV